MNDTATTFTSILAAIFCATITIGMSIAPAIAPSSSLFA